MGERNGAGVAISVMLLAGMLLTACAPTPPPPSSPPAAPTTTVTSEEQAYRAAEETYRSYVAAVNARRVDVSASPDPLMFLGGSALVESERAQRAFASKGIRLTGDTRIASVEKQSSGVDGVVLLVCVDSGGVRVLDRSGNDITPADRADRGLLEVRLEQHEGRALIVESREGDSSC